MLPLAVFVSAFLGLSDAPDPAAVERGRQAVIAGSFLSPAWSSEAWDKLVKKTAPVDPRVRYGLHEPPFENGGLPMGVRKATRPDGSRVGLQLDCLICHGGTIGGTSYIGLGNTRLDLQGFLGDMTKTDSGLTVPFVFPLNSSRGTVNAGQISATLLSMRNPDLSFRTIPIPFGARMPEMDTPAWWNLRKKSTMYYDGRTDADSVRTNMQFLLGELKLDDLKRLEPTFRDLQAYLRSLTPPKYPFSVDTARAERGRAVFEKTCSKCHGAYGADESYPNVVVPLEKIGTDPARAKGLTPRMVAHYNSTWLGAEHPGTEEVVGYQAPPLDGVWATAPYLHNGSVPTVYHLLNSSERPDRFRRPPTTGFEHYDTERLGWRFEKVEAGADAKLPRTEAIEIFDASRYGLSNRGHTFGDRLTDDERRDVIEYLKTL